MQVECPKCNIKANDEDINAASDTVSCRQCNEVFNLSQILKKPISLDKEIIDNKIPNGVIFEKHSDGFKIEISTKSPAAYFIIPFMFFWSGGSLGGIYGSQIADGKFDLFTSLFGIPFLIGAIIFWTLGLMMAAGKIVITVINNQGNIFTGIGSTGFQRKFNWENITNVSEKTTGKRRTSIVMEGKNKIVFGNMISPERKRVVIELLKKIINERR